MSTHDHLSARAGHNDARLSAAETRGIALLVLAVAMAAGLLLAVALFGRRVAGGPTESLSDGWLLAIGLIVAGLLIGLRKAWFSLATPGGDASHWILPMVFPGLAAILLGAALTGPPTQAAVIRYWLLIWGAEAWCWLAYAGQTRVAREEPSESLDEEEAFEHDALAERDDQRADIVQQFIRIRGDDGRETVSGVLRGTTRGGERSLSFHIAFCPALETRPEITAELLSESSGSVSIGQAEVFGAV